MTRMTVNGEAIHYKLDPETPLLFALRDASNLTGTKHGCYSGDCGSCTVIADGRAVLSCQLTIAAAEGAGTVSSCSASLHRHGAFTIVACTAASNRPNVAISASR